MKSGILKIVLLRKRVWVKQVARAKPVVNHRSCVRILRRVRPDRTGMIDVSVADEERNGDEKNKYEEVEVTSSSKGKNFVKRLGSENHTNVLELDCWRCSDETITEF